MGIAQRTDLTRARRPDLFMSRDFQPGSMPPTLSTNGCSWALEGRLMVRGIPRYVSGRVAILHPRSSVVRSVSPGSQFSMVAELLL